MGKEKLCYCFNYTEGDIRNDFYEHGQSTIMNRIIGEKKTKIVTANQQIPKADDVSQMFARW